MASSPGCEPGLVETRPGGSSRERPEHESEEVVDLTADSPLAEVCLVEDDELEAIDVAMKAAESYWSRKKEVLDASPPTQCKWNMPRLEGRKDSSSKGAAECKKHSMADVAERPRKRPGADRTGKIAKARSILAKSDSSFLERVDRLRAEGGRGGSSCTGDMNGEGPPEVEESLSGGRSIAGGQDVVASVEESLDPQQQAVLDSVLNGNNVFFSGMGGTGKTFLLKRIVAALKKVHGTKAVACCAPTGVAAILCGGQTLHSLAGCGIANTARDFDKLWKDVNKKKWRLLRALVVDEVSMIDPSFLDFLDLQVRQVRGDLEKPFGGLQLVLCGDFCQLPGITKGLSFSDVHLIPTGEDMNEKNIPVGRLEELMGAAFQTNFWRDAAFCYHVLETAHRQSDQAFVDFLAKVRFNRMDEDSERFMGRLSRCLPASDIVPTQLYARNREVDQENQRELARLPGPDVFYEAIDGVAVMPGAPAWAKADLEKNVFFRESVTPKRLVLRVGAQVMLTRNDQNDKSLVNGSRGVVRGFEDKQTALASVRQELKLLRGVGGRSAGEAPEAMAAREAELVSRLAALESGREAEYPLVWFEGAGVGGAGRLKIVGPEPFECEVYMTGTCTRTQVPLKLAWALTVHKSQGATLDRVCVQLDGCKTAGQTYVALSRARSPEGLQVKGFSPSCISANKLSLQFHTALSQGTAAVRHFVEGIGAGGEAGQCGGGGAGVAMWWAPLLGEDEHAKRWRRLFETSGHFRKWVLRHGTGSLPTDSFAAIIQQHYRDGTTPPYSAAQFQG